MKLPRVVKSEDKPNHLIIVEESSTIEVFHGSSYSLMLRYCQYKKAKLNKPAWPGELYSFPKGMDVLVLVGQDMDGLCACVIPDMDQVPDRYKLICHDLMGFLSGTPLYGQFFYPEDLEYIN